MMKRAVVLLSGGLDSATCLFYAKSQGYACYALSFDYGQRHHSELRVAKNIARSASVKQHEVVRLSLENLSHSALTNPTIAVPDYRSNDDIPITYVPARNTVFLSLALGWAESLSAKAIFIGVSKIDYSGYPDCRPDYIAAFQKLANLGTKCGIKGHPIKIETPLIYLSKADTIKLGLKLGIDYATTVSCYRATETGLACGKCDSCYLRKKGFSEAQINDPTHYVR